MSGNRRNFIKFLTAGGTGALVSSWDKRIRNFEEIEEILFQNESAEFNDPEAFWKKVSKHFRFEKGLHYFNIL